MCMVDILSIIDCDCTEFDVLSHSGYASHKVWSLPKGQIWAGNARSPPPVFNEIMKGEAECYSNCAVRVAAH